ncbi:MAG: DUF1345 domain-containing protein [Frankiales bacterium]|nr:DUF1345 domain-containing protein [Frankiales bacterium]
MPVSRERQEPRWHAASAVVAVLVIQVLLTPRLVPGPTLLLPGLEALLLIGLLVASPTLRANNDRRVRLLALVLVGVIAAVNAVTLVELVRRLLEGGLADGRTLLAAAAGVWLTNVMVFALAYWELDRGGPHARLGDDPARPDLLFPQDADPVHAPPDWRPGFADYLFTSLTAATAFSPTDTMPLTARAKLLVGLQSLVSLLTVGLVAARAVNVLT